MKQRIIIEMSGGVDSSTAACLLVRQGYEVIGISMKLPISPTTPAKAGISECCGVQGVEDARQVCHQLGIPFYVVNLEKEFNEKVIDYFCNEYENGRTPNPCVMCNKEIKFGIMLEKAKNLNADYIATGHYARIEYNSVSQRYILKKGIDSNKDQSYFLFPLSQEQLKYSIFPLGEYTKANIRELAREFGLKIHNKPASQEICFIPSNNYKKFLVERKPEIEKKGKIVNKSGKILGEHPGIAFFTIGQRYGLGISHSRPLYVIGFDKDDNKIIVGEEEETYSDELIAKNINWIAIDKIDEPIKVKAQIRYRHKPCEACVSKYENFTSGVEPSKNISGVEPLGSFKSRTNIANYKLKVKFSQPQKAITPGQAVVFYDGDIVVGGGIIDHVKPL